MDRKMDFRSLGPRFLRKFNPNNMDFLLWQNSFEHLVNFLKIPDGVKSYFLLDMLKPSVNKMIVNKIGHEKLLNISYNSLMIELEKMFSKYQEELAARYRFGQRDQMLGESAKQYADVLTNLSFNCNYGFKTPNYLLNRFIVGLRSEEVKSKLLSKKRLNFRDAVNFAEGMQFFKEVNLDALKFD